MLESFPDCFLAMFDVFLDACLDLFYYDLTATVPHPTREPFWNYFGIILAARRLPLALFGNPLGSLWVPLGGFGSAFFSTFGVPFSLPLAPLWRPFVSLAILMAPRWRQGTIAPRALFFFVGKMLKSKS